jgi:valyl-tRNA synthetase
MTSNNSGTSNIPEKYSHSETEKRWMENWKKSGIFQWNNEATRENTFVVDTPPPTVSGSLHMGHVFSYTQTDVIVRFQRMRGKNIFYPMGWDDNGLATERRVQNYFNVRCDAKLPYEKDWQGQMASKDSGPAKLLSRQNFIEACAVLTKEDEAAFEAVWRRLALSLDWNLQYATIDEHCRKISQLSFLDLVEKGQVYSSDAPSMWDTDFRSAVAQAEIEDREIPGAFHDIRFGVEGMPDKEFIIATTRPELLAACIAVVAHPDDERYKTLFGKNAITPLFNAVVPIRPSTHADPEKGSGILMVCTFGDAQDVHWWKQSGLAIRQIIGLDGRLLDIKFGEGNFTSLSPESSNQAYSQLKGLNVKQAQKKIVELLSIDGSGPSSKSKALVGEPKPITHAVKFYEKGDRPLEFVSSRQWFIKILEHKNALLEQGRKISWSPEHMRSRYENWVEGLNQDWCISRQRFFGVPFPVWYKIDAQGNINYSEPIYANQNALPVDPLSDTPPGFKDDQRDKPNGFCGDPDVMDTWATSSLTPQIQSHWQINSKRHQQLFPMDLRPQGHDIIRTWAFYTIAKAWLHEKQIPWKNIALSGWILDPDRKKMSKSKGNVVTPESLLLEHSADAVRYWASRARLGIDTAFDPSLFKIGSKLTTKLFNASRFVLSQIARTSIPLSELHIEDITEALDCALVQKMRTLIASSTKSFEEFDYANALQLTEELFWNYCDHYLELVKVRSYHEEDTPGRRSAFATLAWSLKTFLRLFAPFLPYITEEIWTWSFAGTQNTPSIHKSSWPVFEEVSSAARPRFDNIFELSVALISDVRGKKTSAQKNLKWPVENLAVKGSHDSISALQECLSDLIAAGNVKKYQLMEDSSLTSNLNVEVTLAENA